MKVVFIVQGEGRGHMTQALSLEQILKKNGHHVSSMVVGTSKRREIPSFFKARTNAVLHLVKSPNFYFRKDQKSIALWQTAYKNAVQIPLFLKEIVRIRKIIKAEKPDVIINFYDILGGFYFLLANPNAKRLSLAHQYLAQHSSFPFAEGSLFQKRAYLLSNFLTSLNSHKALALSFDKLQQEQVNTCIVPPLLRKEVKELTPANEGFILTYVVNKGYGDEILEWHQENRKVKLICFWDNYDYPDGWSPRKNITFRHLDDTAFLEAMAHCAGYVSTAGFESICEAMYLGKPVMMVPVKGHYEQACNALDAVRVGAGITANKFKLGPFLSHLTRATHQNKEFKNWADSAEMMLLKEIESFIAMPQKRKFKPINAVRQAFKNISSPHQQPRPATPSRS